MILILEKTKIELFDKSEKILDVDDSRITFTSPENEYDLTMIEIKEQEQLKIEVSLSFNRFRDLDSENIKFRINVELSNLHKELQYLILEIEK